MTLEAKERRRYLDQIAELEERIRVLEEGEALSEEAFFHAHQFGLSKQQSEVFALLFDQKTVRRASIVQLIDPEANLMHPDKHVDVVIYHIRRKTESFGYRIDSVRGVGYRLVRPSDE